jgi:hypothetical protein
MLEMSHHYSSLFVGFAPEIGSYVGSDKQAGVWSDRASHRCSLVFTALQGDGICRTWTDGWMEKVPKEKCAASDIETCCGSNEPLSLSFVDNDIKVFTRIVLRRPPSGMHR